MLEIIPAILTKNKQEFKQRLLLASSFAKTIQIDIMDGLFVENKTPRPLNNGSWYKEYLTENTHPLKNIELHLMVINPWKIIKDWQELSGLKKIIWHVEAPIDHEEMILAVHQMGLKTCLAINPKTLISQILPYIPTKPNNSGQKKFLLDGVLVMGVMPGYSGQPFIKDVLKNIKTLHKKFPQLPISVDGGVNLQNAKSLINAGATKLNAAGAIFLADNPKIAYNKLLK